MIRVPLFALFLLLIAFTLVSIGSLVGVLDSLLSDEAARSARAAVRGALEHASELVANPFDETVAMVRRTAADTFERNDRLDDGRTDPATMRPLLQQYLSTVKGARAPIYALYQTFMVGGDNNSWTFAGCFPDDAYCLMYRSNGFITMSATFPGINTTITGGGSGVATWNYTTSPFATRVRGMTRADSAGRWGTPELFYDQVTDLLVPFITFHVPVFFDSQGRCLLSENIDLKSDGLKAQLREVTLPDTDVILFHPEQGTLLATTFDIPSYKQVTIKTPGSTKLTTALWPATQTPNRHLNDAVRRFSTSTEEAVVIDDDQIFGVYPLRRGTLRLTIVTITQKDFFFATLRKTRMVGIAIGVGCAAICTIVSLLVTVLIHRALVQLRRAMVPASRLQMDPDEYNAQGRSCVADVATIQEAFGQMNEKLHIAGAYLPQSLKAAWAREDDADNMDDYDDDESGSVSTAFGRMDVVHFGTPEGNLAITSPARQNARGSNRTSPHLNSPFGSLRRSPPAAKTPSAVSSPIPPTEQYTSPNTTHPVSQRYLARCSPPPAKPITTLSPPQCRRPGAEASNGDFELYTDDESVDPRNLSLSAVRTVAPHHGSPTMTCMASTGPSHCSSMNRGHEESDGSIRNSPASMPEILTGSYRHARPGSAAANAPTSITTGQKLPAPPPNANSAPGLLAARPRPPSRQGQQSESENDHSTMSNRSWDRSRGHARITVLQVNLVGFHKAVASMSYDTVAQKSTVLTDIISTAAKENKGIVDTFHGDRYTLTFNAATPCAAHTRRAVSAALQIRRAVADASTDCFDLPVSCGVAVGNAMVGDLGSSSIRRFGTISPVVAQASVLERMCRQYGPEIPCVVAQNAFEDLSVHFAVTGVDFIRVPGLVSTGCLIGAVVRELSKDREENEWLYVVGSGAVDITSGALSAALKPDSAAAAMCLVEQIAKKEAVLSPPTNGIIDGSHGGDAEAALAASVIARTNVEILVAEAAAFGDLTARGRSLGKFFDGCYFGNERRSFL